MKKHIRLVVGLALSFLFFSLLPVMANRPPANQDIQKLVNEQKYNEALKLVQKTIEEMKSTKNDREWARLIVQEAMLKVGLHGYETAVKELRAREWPKDPAANAMVSIAYAKTLQNYHQAYSWEIRRREKMSADAFDLKTLTSAEIYQEAYKGLERAWNVREQLGKFKRDELPEIITANNYPAEVRGTLRDTLSYLMSEFFNDSSGWSPEHTNNVYALNPDELLQSGRKISITDTKTHPFTKAAYILKDLEDWHEARGRKEAALEARLELYRHMWQQLTAVSAKKKILQSLESLIAKQKSNPWVSMAYATLSEFYRAKDEVKIAHSWALKGAALFTRSPGAARCRDILKLIEQPSLSLEGMNIDTSSRKSLSVNYKNLRKVYFRSFRVDFKNFIRTTKDYSLRPGWRELERYLQGTPDQQWARDLPETSDFKQHRQFITPPAHKPGLYAILVSNDEKFQSGVVHGVETFISDYIFQITKDFEKQEFKVQVLQGSNGEPVRDAAVSLYSADYQSGHKLQAENKTDENGYTAFVTRSILNTNKSFFFIVEKNGHVAGSRNPEAMYASGKPGTGISDAFIYTDRSFYRPEQKILWKIVAYRGDRGEKNFQVDNGQSVTVQLQDANYQVVHKQTVKTNRFGSASGEFQVPKGKLLGQWSLTTTHGGSASIRVEEYKRPTFLVEFDEKGTDLRLNKEAVIKGQAKYYFGMPLTKGAVKWSVSRRAILPWWCFWGNLNWGHLQNNEMVASGIEGIKSDGSFFIRFTPKVNEDVADLKDIRYHYVTKADVTDEGGETQSAESTHTLGFTAVSASFEVTDNFFLPEQKGEVEILRSDLSGRPLPGKGTWKLTRLILPETTLSPADIPVPRKIMELSRGQLVFPDDMARPRWAPEFSLQHYLRDWGDGEIITSGETVHGADGKYRLLLPQLKPGAYRVRFQTKDAFNTVFEEQKEILVVDSKTTFPVPGMLVLQKRSGEPGEKARVFVTSGFRGQRMVLETFRSSRMVSRKILKAGKDSGLIEIPVAEGDRGGLAFTLAIVNDYQDVRFSESLMVPWSNKLVDVSFSTMRDKIRPGSKETWSISLKGKNGRKIGPEAFELLAYMYDKSLDSFGPHQPPVPVYIYPSGSGSSFPDSELGPGTQIHTNLSYFPVSTEFNPFRQDHINYYPSYGIGGPGRRGGPGGGMMNLKGRLSEGADMEFAASAVMDAAAPQMAKMSSRAQPVAAEKEATPKTPAVEIRTNFSETAFWKPHLVSGKNGSVSFEFTVPDSVTSWQLWAHALSKDLQSGSVLKSTRSIKELMVRPYLPRFFREGDEATVRMVINNSSDRELAGEATFEILDENSKSLGKAFGLKNNQVNFLAKAGDSTTVAITLKVPAGPRTITIRAIAKSGNISDGEVRQIPVLPGRMHLAESKFVTLMNKDKSELSFPGLQKPDDPSLVHDLFVVTLDAQLFYSILSSLPYLMNYPYQNTEQMMNSFVSSGIVSSVFKEFPEVGKMAKEFSSRKTRLEKWDEPDPNRKLALEEAPWLRLAGGGETSEDQELISILDPDIAKNARDKYLRLIRESQTASGGFPWFSGGPPSPWITTYLLYGFSKALEFRVEVPKEMIVKAWGYLHQHYISEIVRDLMAKDVGWETVTFLNYVLSNYPDSSWTGGVFKDSERAAMLDFGMKHWKEHSPYLKSYLALTLSRAGRTTDAKLVWDSVMDSAKTSREEGTHWAQEDRSWLWYNDTIETHALALRTGSELGTKKDSLDGMVQWLFLNKKLNHWKSTRATSEVIYSLTQYLRKTKQLGVREKISVEMNGKRTDFDFDPARYTGKKNQIVIPPQEISEKTVPVIVEKTSPGIAFASATWHYSTEKLPKKAVGDFFNVGRKYFRRVAEKSGMKLIAVKEGEPVRIGDEIEVQLSLNSKHQAEYVHLKDPRPAGFEPVDQVSKHKWDLGIYWYEEIRDSGTNFFFERLPHGQYSFKYRIRAATEGKFRAGPATIQPLYAPEFAGFSEGHEILITPK